MIPCVALLHLFFFIRVHFLRSLGLPQVPVALSCSPQDYLIPLSLWLSMFKLQEVYFGFHNILTTSFGGRLHSANLAWGIFHSPSFTYPDTCIHNLILILQMDLNSWVSSGALHIATYIYVPPMHFTFNSLSRTLKIPFIVIITNFHYMKIPSEIMFARKLEVKIVFEES
jgi:hypothetical protein